MNRTSKSGCDGQHVLSSAGMLKLRKLLLLLNGLEKPRTLKLIALHQLVHCTCRPNLAMNMEKKNVTDRELLSELFENPIHPQAAQAQCVSLFINTCSFILRNLNGREYKGFVWEFR